MSLCGRLALPLQTVCFWFTAAQLAQLDKRRSAKLGAAGLSPGRTNTQGL